MKNQNLLTLELFNSVVTGSENEPVFIENHGVFVDSKAAHALEDIKSYLHTLKLSGNELNKTFHKSWATVVSSSRLELAIQQVLHYMSTYGSNFEDTMYVPSEVLEVPKVKLPVSVIRSFTKEEMVSKCLELLCSGIALKEETLNMLFDLLDFLEYRFSGKEGIKNKEANLLIAVRYKVYPKAAEEFVRYLVYRATTSTSLVKNNDLFNKIVNSRTDISSDLQSYDLVKLSSIFNRFKVIFLSFKKAHKNNVKFINKLSKLSKVHHKALPENALNLVTQRKLEDSDVHWLDNATLYALFKALSACYTRKNGQDSFLYRIRNGKSWAKTSDSDKKVVKSNYKFLMKYLKTKLNGKGKTVFISENVVYALPTSERLFVGNIPTGTKFLGERLAAGIYWRNEWGASDLDLSGLNISGKIGWNSDYYNDSNSLVYSGDLTNASNGAVEYLYANKNKNIEPTLVMNNVYSGDDDAGYKIVVGQGDNINPNYMMNPEKVMALIQCKSIQKNTVLGLFMSENNKLNSFTLLNFGAGHARVSGSSTVSEISTKALYQQWKKPISLNKVLKKCGFTVVHSKEEDVKLFADLSLDNLTKSTFIDLFKKD